MNPIDPTNLLAARSQMAVSLGFHIVFASIGIAMPFFMAVAQARYLRSGEDSYHLLTKAWSKGVAIFFAVGAVSGTVLSFELGLLWPGFMAHAGPIIGMPFSWEGTAFFLEAIALGLFLYGEKRLSPWTHWACGLLVGISGVLSAIFVIAANAWMNTPAGFTFEGGSFRDIDPVRAMFNDSFPTQAVHMVFAAFIATGFAVAGLHALLLFRGSRHERLHRDAIRIALVFAGLFSLLQPLSGDLRARRTAAEQPEKFAAMEALFQTQPHAPLTIGGWPLPAEKRTAFALHIPGLLSYLVAGDAAAVMRGLDEFAEDETPPVAVVHLAFQLMVGIGTVLAALSLYFLWRLFSTRGNDRLWPRSRWELLLLTALVPLGFIALEAGWVVTEVGRQPWIVYRVMRTAEAVTPMPGILFSCGAFTAIYLFLSAVLVWLMERQIRHLEEG